MALRRMLSERSLNSRVTVVVLVLLAMPVACCQEQAALSLGEALAYALNHNPRIAAATSRVAQAEAGVSLSGSLARPAVTLRASGRLQGPVQQIDIPIPGGQTVKITRPDQASASIGVVWPLWTGGRVSAAVDAARAQVGAAEADLQQATEQLLYEVGAAYYRVLYSHRQRDEAEATLARAETDAQTAATRQRAGVLTAAEVAAAEAALRRAQQQLAAAANAIDDAEEHLNQFLGRPLDTPVALVDEPVEFELPSEPDQPAVALSSRPELLALEHRQEAAEAAIAQARAERNPTVSAAAQAGWQTPTEVMEAHSEFIGLEFSWPILSSPDPGARRRQAEASARELAETRENLETLIATQVAESARRVADAQEALAAAEEALRAASEARREVAARYQAGAATGQQLVAADSANEEAAARRDQARYTLSAALLAQARALGLMRTLALVPPEEVAGQ